MKPHAVAVSALLATANVSYAGSFSDGEALGIARKHCITCHTAKAQASKLRGSAKKYHPGNGSRPKKYAAVILTQTVPTKAMPLGNETEMTDEERAILG